MTRYVIGTPGAPARLLVETSEATNPSQTLLEGEVILPVETFENGIIAEDGLSFIPTGIDYELEAIMIRSYRTAMLSASDWTQAEYAPLTPEQKAAWAAYRQALRDLPTEQPNATRETVVWPVEPS